MEGQMLAPSWVASRVSDQARSSRRETSRVGSDQIKLEGTLAWLWHFGGIQPIIWRAPSQPIGEEIAHVADAAAPVATGSHGRGAEHCGQEQEDLHDPCLPGWLANR